MRRLTSSFLLTALWLSLVHSPSSLAQVSTGFTKKYHTYQGITIPYYTFVPSTYDSLHNYPLVLCLHGSGEKGDDSTVVEQNSMALVWRYPMEQAIWPCLIVVPQCPTNAVWSQELMLLTLNNLLDSLLVAFRVDTNRIYLTGLSMGGAGTWNLATLFPNRFAAAVPMSGNGVPSKASVLRRLPIWAFHGEADGVVSVMGSRNMISAIEKTGLRAVYAYGLSDSALMYEIQTGASLLYTEYPNAGHAIWDEAYHDPHLLPWVFLQSKAATAMLTYTREVQVGPPTPRKNQDSVTIRARVDNPGGHTLAVTAQITDLGTGATADSLQLHDDGAHSDDLPGDAVWGKVFVPVAEGVFSVNVWAFDPTVKRPSVLSNTAFFATGGPVTIDRVEVATADSNVNPGDALRYRMFLKNRGSSYTVKNITAWVSCPDTSVQLAGYNMPYGDLAPGQSSSGTGLQPVRFSATRPGNYVVPFTVRISSCGVQFWTDHFSDEVTGVSQPWETLPKNYALLQNYPNPFNPSTTIAFTVAGVGSQASGANTVKLVVYDLLGREVAVLVNEKKAPGSYEVRFDASALSSGVYIYRLRAGNYVETRKMVVLR